MNHYDKDQRHEGYDDDALEDINKVLAIGVILLVSTFGLGLLVGRSLFA